MSKARMGSMSCLCVLGMLGVLSLCRPALSADVAVLMSANIDAYKQALAGCKAVLHHRIVAEYAMQGDLSEGSKALAQIRASVKPDLILAVGVLALQSVVEQQPDTPVVFSMVLNPLGVLGEVRKNIAGASMNVSPKFIFEVIEKLGPQVQRVGVIYTASHTGHLVRAATAAARDRGLQVIGREIASSREVLPALDVLRDDEIDLLWIVPDETILAPEVVEQILLASYTSKIPVLGLSHDQAQQGAILSLQFASSEDIGRQAGELANRILEGEPPSEVGYTSVRQINVTVNLKAAQKLGFTVPESILAIANTLIQ